MAREERRLVLGGCDDRRERFFERLGREDAMKSAECKDDRTFLMCVAMNYVGMSSVCAISICNLNFFYKDE